jgi:pSer/pThr/pTyr-binding forkhead associated (FHA) protein
MIVCPNCNHPNPDGAVQCEACYTPLPVLSTCPNCGASVQADASFCGQCGFNLQGAAVVSKSPELKSPEPESSKLESSEGASELPAIEPLVPPDPLIMPLEPDTAGNSVPMLSIESPESPEQEPIASAPAPSPLPTPVSQPVSSTQLQTQSARLLHVQTNMTLELPTNLSVIHIGKPNDRVPPDVDVSGFPNSEIVSRIHADIRVEADAYYIEDLGSSNGTYINNVPLPSGNRHRLRVGDRIALGKGDKVTFLFQA